MEHFEDLRRHLFVHLPHEFSAYRGVLTFKKSDALRDIARDVPLDRLLVETDAPFLAPDPFRGKRNEPAHVARTAAVLASVKGVSEEEIARVTTDNFFRFYAKAKRPGASTVADGGSAAA